MAETATRIEDLMLNITEEIHVKAPMGVTFDTLLEQLGSLMGGAEDRPMPMKIEPWPGGRWYRDLGDDNGHLWGHVQAIKRPTLIEIYGPLIMSYPAISNLQYRLSEEAGGTVIQFHHQALGLILEEHRQGIPNGWRFTHGLLKERAEALFAARKTGH